MKVQIPDRLKDDVPQTLWGKILTATPVVMAVVATMLAGLASSEMNRAQYSRSLAAQQQSKAGDQWSFFQAKRLRGTVQLNSIDLLRSLVGINAFTEQALRRETAQLTAEGYADLKAQVAEWLASANAKAALSVLAGGDLPPLPPAAALNTEIQATLAAIDKDRPETEIAAALGKVPSKVLDEAVAASGERAQAFDDATNPLTDSIGRLERLLAKFPSAAGALSVTRDFTAARLQYAAARYETEARLNQAVANLYELQVRKSNTEATRHHARSQRFFFGMLGAQLGVIIATFAIAARKRNLLWGLAAGAGLIAILFAIYVYIYV